MKIKIERDVFADAVAWVLRSVGSRATLPVLGGVLIEADGDTITFTGTDLEVSSEAKVQAAVAREGKVLLPGRVLGDIARSLPEGTVELTADQSMGKIVCGAAEFTLRTLPVEDFPQIALPDADAATIDGKLFASAVAQVTKAASHDEARPILTGVLLEAGAKTLTLVATDSYRLAVREIDWTAPGIEGKRVVPARALVEAVKAAEGESEIKITLGESQVSVEAGGRTLVSRLIEGEFPNWRQLIPTDIPSHLTIARDAFADSVRRVGILAQQGAPVRLELNADGVKLLAGTQDLGEANEAAGGTFEGEAITVAFNPVYLNDGIAAAGGAEIKLSLRDGLKPALVTSTEQDGFTYLLMPVRI
ncbi:MAG TPA: DNA polymerase III subunit beta [Actinomycetota bacterium]|nr:DNA polymerase III subunit beta [Actinomycetota bacterium]